MPWSGRPAPRKPPPGPKGWYSTQDISRALRVSDHVVKRAIASGELVGAKIGRGWRVSPEALDAWLLSRTVLPAG